MRFSQANFHIRPRKSPIGTTNPLLAQFSSWPTDDPVCIVVVLLRSFPAAAASRNSSTHSRPAAPEREREKPGLLQARPRLYVRTYISSRSSQVLSISHSLSLPPPLPLACAFFRWETRSRWESIVRPSFRVDVCSRSRRFCL